jgi:23S rRNA pseudouridine2605 synthase
MPRKPPNDSNSPSAGRGRRDRARHKAAERSLGAAPQRSRGTESQRPRSAAPRQSRGEGSQRSRGTESQWPRSAESPRSRGTESQRSRSAAPRQSRGEGSQRARGVEPQRSRGAAPQRSRGAKSQRSRGEASQQLRGGEPQRSRGAEPERLQKVLSRAGLASRREVEEWIRAGRITINGEPAVLGVRVTASDHVRLDGRLIRQRETGGAARVFLCHRSPGENLQQPIERDEDANSQDFAEPSEEPNASADTVRGSGAGIPLIERIPRRAGRRFIPVSPMPRVDGGLELVTSDGDLASKLQRSMRRLTSEFSVRVHGELSPQGLESIVQGMLDNGEKLEIEHCDAAGGEGSNRWYSLVARGASGKDVRQLFERQGALVSRVLRTQLGSLALDRHLSRGRFRELSPEELAALLATASDTATGVLAE